MPTMVPMIENATASRTHATDGLGCDSASCSLTFELGQSLLDQPRTLIISHKGQSQWGFGNLIPIVLAYHTLCFVFHRKCVIQMMNTGLEKFYRYRNGMKWWQKSNFTVEADKKLTSRGVALVKALQEFNSSTVIRVQLKHQPDFAIDELVKNLELPPSVRRPCILRWFAEPSHALGVPRANLEFNRALHLRTDWADLSNAQRSYGVYNASVSRQWLLHACPNLSAWGGDDLVISDSPGILKSARALGIQVGSAVTLRGRTHSALNLGNTKDKPGRNSSEARNSTEDIIESSVTDLLACKCSPRRHLLPTGTEDIIESSVTDLHWLMHARVVYTGGSSFTRPAQLGALCADFRSLRQVCPNYPLVFPREFHKMLPPEGRHSDKYAAISSNAHAACYNLSAVACLKQYVQAISSQEADAVKAQHTIIRTSPS